MLAKLPTETKDVIDVADTKAKIHRKITHSFINLWFKREAEVPARYSAGKKIREAMSDHMDTRHLKTSMQSRAEDQPKRTAMGKFYSFLRKHNLDKTHIASQWVGDTVEMYWQEQRGEGGTLLGTWLSDQAGWEVSLQN